MTIQNTTQALETKKAILDRIAEVKQEEKNGASVEALEAEYEVIIQAIEAMKGKVKPNTIAYLRTQLKNTLGKYEPYIEEKVDHFIEFFKEAYPDGKRRKDYTVVLIDKNKITVDQILQTLKYINGYCLKNRISYEVKKDIFPMIEKVAKTDSLRHINQVRSMEGIRKALKIKIISTPQGHKVVKI
ncbi:MAG: hypothetical protein ACRDDX_06780 [Cellulosilyticaceae bacterium]